MTFAGWTIGARLTVWYLAVLVLATLVLAGGSSWLMRRSLSDAADTHLRARIDGVERLIASMQRALPAEDVPEEMNEYMSLTQGDGLLEVGEPGARPLCRPSLSGWDAVRAHVAGRPIGAPPLLADAESDGRTFRVAARRATIGSATYEVIAALPMGPAQDALARFEWTIAGLAPVVLCLAGLGGYWISRRALAPVDRMTRDVQAMTLRSLDRRIDVPRAEDEVRRLALTFNDLLARLEAGVADMARFTADAAHELRTPVTLVRTTADVALSRERPEAEYRQALADVLAHAEQMSAIVSELLLLARADAGVEPRATATVDLGAVAADATRAVSAEASRRGLVLEAELPPGRTLVTGDAASLRRLLLLLLDNAVKYTPSGGHVRVRVGNRTTPAGTGATLEVIDTGPGVDATERTRVFDRFYRGLAARQRVADGTGLGLSIAKAIVVRHHGTISIDDGDAGAGCRVSVALPASADHSHRS